MTTVGFGDYVPLTALGKIVTLITALSPQKTAYNKLIKVRTAAKTIIAALRLQVAKKRLRDPQNMDSTESTSKFIYSKDNVKRCHGILDKNIKKFREVSDSVKASKQKVGLDVKVSED